MGRPKAEEKCRPTSFYIKERLLEEMKRQHVKPSETVNYLLESYLIGTLKNHFETIQEESKRNELLAREAEIKRQLNALEKQAEQKQELKVLTQAHYGKEGQSYLEDTITILKLAGDPIKQRKIAEIRAETLKHYGRSETTEDLLYLALKDAQRKEIS